MLLFDVLSSTVYATFYFILEYIVCINIIPYSFSFFDHMLYYMYVILQMVPTKTPLSYSAVTYEYNMNIHRTTGTTKTGPWPNCIQSSMNTINYKKNLWP